MPGENDWGVAKLNLLLGRGVKVKLELVWLWVMKHREEWMVVDIYHFMMHSININLA